MPAKSNEDIIIKGARVHNLQNVSLRLPRNQLICLTGVSGSGKSSLAFDTLYAEGQRRYVESLSSYARQFLGQMEKPDVDLIAGLSPCLSIEQKTAGRNPRSTVGTITEVYDYLRVLFARVGVAHCTSCGDPIGAQTREQIIGRILAQPAGTKFMLLAPVVRGQRGEYRDLFDDLRRLGFLRARVNGQVLRLTDAPDLDRNMRHDIEVVLDRLTMRSGLRSRVADAVDGGLEMGDGVVILSVENEKDVLLSSRAACTRCGLSFPEPSPQLFSFNSPHGMCPTCDGLGAKVEIAPDLLVRDDSLSLRQGCLALMRRSRWWLHLYEGVGEVFGFDLDTPWREIPEDGRHMLLYGSGQAKLDFVFRRSDERWSFRHRDRYPGIIPDQMESYVQSQSKVKRRKMEAFMSRVRCPDCHGARLRPEALAVHVGGRRLDEICAGTVAEAAEFFNALELTPQQVLIAEDALREIRSRLQFLLDVGLHYLTLDRSAPTLSGGEAQRIRLASQVGCGLVGVTYILDEPSIGLHPRDLRQLLLTLQRLRDVGNTVVVVEHDEDTMRAADCLIDFGPGAGDNGGKVVARGALEDVVRSRRSITGRFLSGRECIDIPSARRPPTEDRLVVRGARHHNLQNIDVEIPLGLLVVVTGVSGSGKSSLVTDILYRALARELMHSQALPGDHVAIEGMANLDKVISVDQSPIGRTPRSNPATYIKVWDLIRRLFAALPEARARGYKPGRFSFNVTGGRCEACSGNGAQRLEMDFLADVWATCPVCQGRRFNHETLQIRFKGKTIADILEMDVAHALEHFSNQPKIQRMLQTLYDVGMDYVKLGQPSPTLSGGEAQRIKLARELCRPASGRTLYLLDEPTTGLHAYDVRNLLRVLQRLVDAGNTVLVIEHNMEVVKSADWIIDLGPEGGEQGGRVVCTGAPETVAQRADSYTGQALAGKLNGPAPAVNGSAAGRGRRARPLRRISVHGAAQHNLRDVNLSLPRDQITVFSGVSGSGKTSLALDTLFAEGQRRYVESLSPYARQFISQMPKPKVEKVTGLSPAIAIDQKAPSRSPRSTVGTVTEVYDYLRILFARLGTPYCPHCGEPIGSQTADQIIDRIGALPTGKRIFLLAPVERRDNETYDEMFARLQRDGFMRVRVDGEVHNVESLPVIDPRSRHIVEIVVDRLTVRPQNRGRIADSVETTLGLGGGELIAHDVETGVDTRYSQHFTCRGCGKSYEELRPRHFSFNGPLGWCPTCQGLGVTRGADLGRLAPNWRKSVREGAFTLWGPLLNDDFRRLLEAVCRRFDIPLDAPLADLDRRQREILLFGSGHEWVTVETDGAPLRVQYRGLMPTIEWASRLGWSYRMALAAFDGQSPCTSCRGGRLRADAAAVRFRDRTLRDLCDAPLAETYQFFRNLRLDDYEHRIIGEVLHEIRTRLKFLVQVGMGYLTLSRSAPTLSGGESQRIRLASQIGSGLTGVLYVLDEPTIGLHPRDTRRLLRALTELRDLGNTIVVVEHDRDTLEHADYLVDFGPGGGAEGGRIVARGDAERLKNSRRSVTGRYLRGSLAIPVPANRRPATGRRLVVRGARQNNLRNLDVEFPVGVFTCVTGVSGSGKSSLVNDIIWRRLSQELHSARHAPAQCDEVAGIENFDKVINIDQQPIGDSPRSSPATYVGAFDAIRALFAQLPAAKERGYLTYRFSFNRMGGRCEACEGLGQRCIEMHFLPDVWVDCEVCHGDRYNPETLEIKYKGKSIADVLRMTVDEARHHFHNLPQVLRPLDTLHDVGLGYVPLGQSATTLSGGEAQRVKLARELSRRSWGRTLYLLDEPTTGLHMADVEKLLNVLHRLVDAGNTVIVIEHNMEVIKTADWIIDLGPEGGEEGGRVVAAGPPEEVVKVAGSHTGRALRRVLRVSPRAERSQGLCGAEAPSPPPESGPAAQEMESSGQLRLADISGGTLSPWERDGVAWHTQLRSARNGQPCRWEGQALQFVVELAERQPGIGRAIWSHENKVTVSAQATNDDFLYIRTDYEWWFRCSVRTGKDQFNNEQLWRDLDMGTWNDRSDLGVYGSALRVRVKQHYKRFDEVTIDIHDRSEIDTPAFRRFIAEAADGFLKAIGVNRSQ